MKVFIIDTINNIPGHKQFQDFSKYLVKKNVKVVHFSTNNVENFEGVEVVYWGMNFKIKSFFIFFHKFLKEKPDVVISTFRGNLFADFFSYFFKFRYYPFFRSDFYNQKWINKIKFRRVEKFIVLSKPMVPRIENMFPHLKNKIYVMFNSFDFNKISFIKKEDIILHVGGVSFNSEGKLIKGTDVLIQAFTNLKKENNFLSNYKLIVVGSGEGLKEVKNSTLSQDIIFTGKLSNLEVHKLMLKAKLFVLPSRNDAFPNVLLEAMQHSCCLIGTFGTGSQDVIEESDYGYLVEKENVEDLEIAIRKGVINYKSSDLCWQAHQNKINYYSRENWINEMYKIISN
ncbi:glycosyltransferase family 4 protein [Flavobacterium sp. UBA6135]|uniref:glycosyltransferase family 4 protein n=1 Tax=Flavobacterium sp. UBA6135 TaxID=1946553 RepID=UPI0025C673B8|nr:glycosyltransferase family 4 protein [Flavobacterium sp. UBA6135]